MSWLIGYHLQKASKFQSLQKKFIACNRTLHEVWNLELEGTRLQHLNSKKMAFFSFRLQFRVNFRLGSLPPHPSCLLLDSVYYQETYIREAACFHIATLKFRVIGRYFKKREFLGTR